MLGRTLYVTAPAVVCVAACGAGAATTAPPAGPPTASLSVAAAAAPTRHRPVRRALPFSTASGAVVQPQPAPGSCHARGSGGDARPDPRCTAGALNPSVRQWTIHATICVDGWTRSVRPPEPVTEREKAASMSAYGDHGPMSAYEYDHFVPLELGGAANDPRNLWPEPGASPNPKDAVEGALRDAVCAGRMSLAEAQRAIVGKLGVARRRGARGGSPRAGGSSSGRRHVHGDRGVQQPLPRLRRVRPLQPAARDGDRHRRGRRVARLAHR